MIKAWLTGDSFDLEILAELFPAGEPLVAADVDGWYLQFAATGEPIREGGPLRDAAQAVLGQANGVARMQVSNFRPVQLSGRFVDDAGGRHTVVQVGTAECRVRAMPVTVMVNNKPLTPPPQPPPGPRAMQLAAAHLDAAEVLALLANADRMPSWGDLYKILEIVESNVGGSWPIVQRGWASKTQLNAFGAAANHPALSGTDARHARQSGSQPRGPGMTRAQGLELIRAVVQAWLDWLRMSSPTSP